MTEEVQDLLPLCSTSTSLREIYCLIQFPFSVRDISREITVAFELTDSGSKLLIVRLVSYLELSVSLIYFIQVEKHVTFLIKQHI